VLKLDERVAARCEEVKKPICGIGQPVSLKIIIRFRLF
jgi:hypothetical protein